MSMTPGLRRSLAALAPVWILAGCSESLPPDLSDCTQDPVPGVEVYFLDGHTKEWISDRVVGVARDGTYVDTLTPGLWRDGTLVSLAGAYERAGTYEVILTAEGYREWRREGVRVRRADKCHVRTEDLLAFMIPER